MIIESFPVGPLQCNCTIVGDEASKQALVFDPGGDLDAILLALAKHELKAVGILHTHAHIDHVGATTELAEKTGAPTYLHGQDDMVYQSVPMQAMFVGMRAPEMRAMDHGLDDNQSIKLGEHEIGVLHTPGHTPGSVCFELPGSDLCLSGDTLFMSGIGRTDLPGGDHAAIERSIRDRLYTMNGAVQVIPGHGPNTSIDQERNSNPFVRARS